jgi:tryptophan synthase alpha chain
LSRIAACFDALAATGRKALIPYITAGDPSPDATVPLMHAMVKAGADVIELGMPFSDPMADGPVIQKACERSLAAGTSLKKVLQIVAEFRRQDAHTPVVLMGYLNPVEAMGYETFVDAASESGIDGLLLVDLPPEESAEVAGLCRQRDLDMIFLLAPTTSDARMDVIARAGSGYLYYVSLKGVTGSASLNVDEVAGKIETIRNHSKLPIGVGFGIKDAESARQVSRVADGVVVGSALIERIAAHGSDPERMISEVSALLGDMRAAMDQQA